MQSDYRADHEVPDQSAAPYPWSRLVRRLVSTLLVFYLLVVLSGPLTIPIGAPHLTVPLARATAPVQQALFLGHGYRFFGPDPGPSHILHYRIQRDDGSEQVGHFPDRDRDWPRLLYHRWFMLSETLFREVTLVPTDEQLEIRQRQYETASERLYFSGDFRLRRQLELERAQETAVIEAARKRRDGLIRSIGSMLLDRFDGSQIQLHIEERNLPTAEEVASGMKLSDPSLINTLELGLFTAEQLHGDAPLNLDGVEVVQPLESPADAARLGGEE